jgi:hypothetical protein
MIYHHLPGCSRCAILIAEFLRSKPAKATRSIVKFAGVTQLRNAHSLKSRLHCGSKSTTFRGGLVLSESNPKASCYRRNWLGQSSIHRRCEKQSGPTFILTMSDLDIRPSSLMNSRKNSIRSLTERAAPIPRVQADQGAADIPDGILDFPPCIRHLPFFFRDRHGVRRVDQCTCIL